MKTFWLTVVGAIAAAAVATGSRFFADYFLAAWKFGHGGWGSAALGFLLAFVNELWSLSPPASRRNSHVK